MGFINDGDACGQAFWFDGVLNYERIKMQAGKGNEVYYQCEMGHK